jgi:hypothetical protein
MYSITSNKANIEKKKIRYSSLQLIEQLFERSKLFRELLTEDFPLFIQQVVGIQNTELPPPVSVAAKLKQYALALIKNWYIKYGEKYRQIGISFDFLLDNGFMDDNQVSSSLSSIHSDNINKANKSVMEYNLYKHKQMFIFLLF